jgi:hypothetical protein
MLVASGSWRDAKSQRTKRHRVEMTERKGRSFSRKWSWGCACCCSDSNGVQRSFRGKHPPPWQFTHALRTHSTYISATNTKSNDDFKRGLERLPASPTTIRPVSGLPTRNVIERAAGGSESHSSFASQCSAERKHQRTLEQCS